MAAAGFLGIFLFDGHGLGQFGFFDLLFKFPLQEALDAVAAQGVNRLEITGDFIDELALLPKARAILEANVHRFPDGIDFCYGNHEYYRDFNAITAMLEATPVRVLRNSSFLEQAAEVFEAQGRNQRRNGRELGTVRMAA